MVAVKMRFMPYIFRRPSGALFLLALAQLSGGLVPAQGRTAAADASLLDDTQPAGHWRLVVSPYTQHFRPNPEHRPVWAVGLEWQRPDDVLWGASYFRNSFGQPSSYIYAGQRFPALLGRARLFGQISGGLLYGYRGPYANKVPLNYKGFAPGALVSLGWQLDARTATTAHLLGDAGIMIQFSRDLR